jgi:guanylate kinase
MSHKSAEAEPSRQKNETLTRVGKIIVVTGRSGSGKDSVVDKALLEQELASLGVSKVITCASRSPRDTERHGVDYFFKSHQEILLMHAEGQLVEPPVETGTSYKATSKDQIMRVMAGENIIWRVEMTRAMEVARGEFFDRIFPSDIAQLLKQTARVVFIDVDPEDLEKRRKSRDKDRYNPEEYRQRDDQEVVIAEQCRSVCHHIIKNRDGQLSDTIFEFISVVRQIVG